MSFQTLRGCLHHLVAPPSRLFHLPLFTVLGTCDTLLCKDTETSQGNLITLVSHGVLEVNIPKPSDLVLAILGRPVPQSRKQKPATEVAATVQKSSPGGTAQASLCDCLGSLEMHGPLQNLVSSV